jgi:adenylate cyclase
MAETRKITAILAANVVGSSQLARRDEDRTLARLRALRSNLIGSHQGRIVNRTIDDGIIEFCVADAELHAVGVLNGSLLFMTGPEFRDQVQHPPPI